MTNRKLTPEKVQALLDKSTPGPWTLMEPGPLLIDGDGMTVLTRQNGDMLAAAPELATALLTAWKERDEWRVTMVRGMGESTEMVRELADERDALRAELAEERENVALAEDEIRTHIMRYDRLTKERDALRVEVERLRELLNEAHDIVFFACAEGNEIWLDEADKALKD